MNSTDQTQAGRDLVSYMKASTSVQTLSIGGTNASNSYTILTFGRTIYLVLI
jgi:hypothetical protein